MTTLNTEYRPLRHRIPLAAGVAVLFAVSLALAIWVPGGSSTGQADSNVATNSRAGQTGFTDEWLAAQADIGPADLTAATVQSGDTLAESPFTEAWLQARVARRVGAHLVGAHLATESPFTAEWLAAQAAQRRPSSASAESPFTDAWLAVQVAHLTDRSSD